MIERIVWNLRFFDIIIYIGCYKRYNLVVTWQQWKSETLQILNFEEIPRSNSKT